MRSSGISRRAGPGVVARFALSFDARSREDLLALSPDVASRIVRRLAETQQNPRPRGDTIKRLQGFPVPTYRFRVGDYRALFRISGTCVVVLRIIHRSELERALRDLA
jgi:mRNA interferase RelE/StbE